MKNKKIWVSAALGIILVLVIAAFRNKENTPSYRTVAIERGTIEEVVSATGTLQATEMVEVGTQVSGQIAELRADFNDRVSKGQLLARIDPTILANEVRAAEATVARNKAELDQAKRTLERNRQLHQQQVITDSELEQAQYGYSVASANYISANASLERARRNLNYTEIRAPIDGIVVERSVDVGQTVAASTSAPKLFVIAQDLSQMEILASVDESDIGKIRNGQEVRFTVQAFGDREFKGAVQQVRLQSTATENVVSYGVVIEVDNPDGVLLPGMTATVEFLVSSAQNVLKVANAALRYQPPAEARAETAATQPSAQRAVRTSNAQRPRSTAGRPRMGVLWRSGANGKLEPVRVRIGLTDGQYTEISGEGVTGDMQVIAGETSGSAQSSAANPFQNQQQGGRGGPRGF